MSANLPGPPAPIFVGVDLGGTSIRVAAFDASMEILSRSETRTRAEEGVEAVVRRIVDCIRAVLRDASATIDDASGIGIGAAGLTDWRSGTVLLASNLQWRDVPLKRLVSQALGGVRVEVDKDTNVAALAEARLGAGQAFQHFLYVTVGTGIGGGLVLDGMVYRGATGGAGDVGHVVVDPNGPVCGCGGRGHVEVFASGSGIVARAREGLRQAASKDTATHLTPEGLTTQAVFDAARAGDALAACVVERAAASLGLGLANYVNVNNPEAIVIGGGVLQGADVYWAPLECELRRQALPPLVEIVQLVPAGLGADVGVVGAALLLAEPAPEEAGGKL